MGQITREFGEAGEILLQPGQHAVECLRQLLQFCWRGIGRKTPLQTSCGDLPGFVGEGPQGAQRAPHHIASQQAAGQCGGHDGDCQQVAEALQERRMACVVDGQQGGQRAAVGQRLAQMQHVQAAAIGQGPVVATHRQISRLRPCMLAKKGRCGGKQWRTVFVDDVEFDIGMMAERLGQTLRTLPGSAAVSQVGDQRDLVFKLGEVLCDQVVACTEVDRHAQRSKHYGGHRGEQHGQPRGDGKARSHVLRAVASSGASST
ncbi:hypothetical protein D3C72_1019100 [compost metagenome]